MLHPKRRPSSNPLHICYCITFLFAFVALIFVFYPTCPTNPAANGVGHFPDGHLQTTEHASGLEFMHSKKVLLVSHELSLSGGPLLLMELAVLLTTAGARVQWVTDQKELSNSEVVRALETKLSEKKVQILPARGEETIKAALAADFVVLNTAVTGKWIDSTLKDERQKILPKVLWWIHEMRGHYFKPEYVKHLPNVAGVMIDSYATTNYWQNRTMQQLRIKMPKTYVVHLGNSKEFTEAAESTIARHLLRQNVRELLGIHRNDIVFSAINSVSRGKGQDLFLKAFSQALETLASSKSKIPRNKIHAMVVGSDWNAQPKFEAELRELVSKLKMEHLVHFINKTMNVIPYLAASDVLVQNSQARGECFGRISIEAMAFRLPVLGTAAGGTVEIVVNGSTGILHVVGKEGVPALASRIVKLFEDGNLRRNMGERGYERVKEMFMEHHMSRRVGLVFRDILNRAS